MTAASLQVAVHGHNAMACLHAVWLAVSSCSQPLFSPCGDVPLSAGVGLQLVCVQFQAVPPADHQFSYRGLLTAVRDARRAMVLMLTSAPRLQSELTV